VVFLGLEAIVSGGLVALSGLAALLGHDELASLLLRMASVVIATIIIGAVFGLCVAVVSWSRKT